MALYVYSARSLFSLCFALASHGSLNMGVSKVNAERRVSLLSMERVEFVANAGVHGHAERGNSMNHNDEVGKNFLRRRN